MISHPTQDDLVLHFYGEGPQRASTQTHLALCASCRSDYESIAYALAMVSTPVPPDRGDLYGLEVWQRIRPLLPAPDPWSRLLRLRLSFPAMGAVLTVVTIAAFAAGRYWPRTEHPPSVSSEAVTVVPGPGNRALMAAIIDHLERSERMLLDLSNADGPRIDLRAEQSWAADLVDANRLYREAASDAGEATTASILDDLERTLLDIVHAPATLTPVELDHVRTGLEAAALLFKVRVLSNELRERESSPAAPRKTT